MLLAPAQEVVLGDEPVGRARQAPVAVEAGPDQALVGQVVAGEQRRDALVERGLRQRAGRREQAEHGPLDAVGERDRRGGLVGRVGQPPAAGLDLGQARVRRPRHLVADEGRAAARRGPADSPDPVGRSVSAGPLGPDGGAPTSCSAARGREPPRTEVVGHRLARRTPAAGRDPRRRRSARRRARLARRAGRPDPPAERRPTSAQSRRRADRSGREPPQLAGAVEPDEDLAEQALVAGRLAAASQRLDGGLGDGLRGFHGRERALVEPLRRGEQARPGHEVRVAWAALDRGEGHVGAGPRARRPGRARRQELDDPADLVVAAGEPRAHQPIARARPAEDRRDERLGAAVHEHHRVPVAGHGRGGRFQRPADRRGLPAPRRAQGGAGQRVDGQQGRGFPAEHPGRRVVRGAEPLEAGADRWLAEEEADPRGRARSGHSRRARRAGGAGPRGSRARGPRSPSPPRGCAGPRRAAPGAGRGRRPRDAGRTRGRCGSRPRTRATDCVRARSSRSAGGRGRRRSAASPCALARSRAGWRAGSRAGTRAAGPPGPAPRGGRPRCGRGSRRARRAGGACAARGARRRASRRHRPGRSASAARRAPRRRRHRRGRGRGRRRRAGPGGSRVRPAGRGRPCIGSGGRSAPPSRPGAVGSAPSGTPQMTSSTTTIRPHVAQRVAYRSPSETLRLDSRRGRGRHRPGTRRRGGARPAAGGRPRRASGSADWTRARSPGAGDRRPHGRPSRRGRRGPRRRRRHSNAGRSVRRAPPAAAAAPTCRTRAARSRAARFWGVGRPVIASDASRRVERPAMGRWSRPTGT